MDKKTIQLDALLIKKAEAKAKETNRTTSGQIEHWAKIGKMMEDNPDLTYEFAKQSLVSKAEKDAGSLDNYEFD